MMMPGSGGMVSSGTAGTLIPGLISRDGAGGMHSNGQNSVYS